LEGEQLHLYASVCSLDGSVAMECRDEALAAEATALGVRVADQLLARGAGAIIAQQRPPLSLELP
jgi:hydroxymethylbilane synthase